MTLPPELVPTGIAGLDCVLRGGIPRNNVTVVVGPVGSGKTTLGLQFICHGATKCDEPGLVVLFEISPELVTRDASQFGWDLGGLEQQGRIRILYTTRQAFEDELKQPDSVLLAEVRAMGAKRIFIDSYGVPQNGNGSSRDAFHLFLEGLHREQLSAIVSVEVSEPASNPFEQFLADTVIRLGAHCAGGALTRTIEVVKSRGQSFTTGRHSLDIREGAGITVYKRAQSKAEPSGSNAAATDLGPRVSSGIPGLDEMLGGGYRPLSSTLFGGVSGVGKSVAGLQFIAAGLARGERGLFVSLDEPLAQIMRNAASLGIDLAGPSASGMLRIFCDSPQELVLDQHFAEIEALLKEVKPARAVVDSISAYRARIIDPDRGMFNDFFAALVASLKWHGVTAVYNLENPELAGLTTVAGGASLSSIVDNIVLMNWVELGDEYRHAITVAKTRASASTRVTRECEIVDGEGLRVLDRVIPPGVVAIPFAGYRSLTARAPERSTRTEKDEQ